MNSHETIIQPVVTEKTTLLKDKNIYAFWINPKATKIDVKRAIKAIFGAVVADVKIVNTVEKMRALKKGSFNKRKYSRKAYISLVGKAKLDDTKYAKTDSETKVKLLAPKARKEVKAEASEKPATTRTAKAKKTSTADKAK